MVCSSLMAFTTRWTTACRQIEPALSAASIPLGKLWDGVDHRPGGRQLTMFEVVQLRRAVGREEDNEEIVVGASADANVFVPGDTESCEDLVKGEAVMREYGGCALRQGADVFNHLVDISDLLEIFFKDLEILTQGKNGLYRSSKLAGDDAGDPGVGQHLCQEASPAVAGLGEPGVIAGTLLKMPRNVERGEWAGFSRRRRGLSPGEEEIQQKDGIGDVDRPISIDISSGDRGEIQCHYDPFLVAKTDPRQETEEEDEGDGQVFFHRA